MRASEMSGVAIARAVCLTQLFLSVFVSGGIAAAGFDRRYAIAALFGGAVAWVPTAYMALRMFAGAGNRSPQDIVGAMFRGEIGKFALTAVLFAIGVKLFAGQFLALLATYMICLLAYWIVLARASFIDN